MLANLYSVGKKIPLVFIHGYCEDKSMWNEFTDSFSKHTLIVPDLPGFGESLTYDDLSISSMANDLKDLLERKNVEQCILIGHSMGGYVALDLASKLPNKIKGLCMFHSHPFEDLPATKEKREKAVEFVNEHGVKAFTRTLIPNFFAPSLKEKFQSTLDEIIAKASEYSAEGISNAMLAMKNKRDQAVLVEDLACPYHCILGKEDVPTPYDFCIPQINLAKITKVTILNEIGHMGMYSAKEKTQEAIQDFLDFCIAKL